MIDKPCGTGVAQQGCPKGVGLVALKSAVSKNIDMRVMESSIDVEYQYKNYDGTRENGIHDVNI